MPIERASEQSGKANLGDGSNWIDIWMGRERKISSEQLGAAIWPGMIDSPFLLCSVQLALVDQSGTVLVSGRRGSF